MEGDSVLWLFNGDQLYKVQVQGLRVVETQKMEFHYTFLLGKNDPLKFKVALYENIKNVF